MKISTSDIASLPSVFGDFKLKVYKDEDTQKEHIAIYTDNLSSLDAPLVRIHSECLTGDVLGSKKCDCADQLHLALSMITKDGGMVLYLRQEGRGIGLLNKINAYKLQEEGYDTVEANHQLGFGDDEREYSIVEYIFKDFGIDTIKLITNNPTKLEIVTQYGIKVQKRIPIITDTNEHNKRYLETKKTQMGHLL
jgi:GTP cyclohydrolase II